MDPITTARYGLLAAGQAFDAAAQRVAQGTGDNIPDTVTMIEAKQAFAANAQVVRFTDAMWRDLLDLNPR